MNIIPVIDLKDGLAVSAIQGKRNGYQPINSPLCQSSLIEDVLQGYLSIYPFKTFYIADLNAITHIGDNQRLIDTLIQHHPALEFWVDNGKQIPDLFTSKTLKYRPIIGSEYQQINNFQAGIESLKNTVLSLDFFPESGYRGPLELLENATFWPQNVIIMSLEKVGTNTGPDWDRLGFFCKKQPKKNFIAAGGIRHADDLLSLKEIGVNYALIASALHSGAINADWLKKLQREKCPELIQSILKQP